MKWHNDPSRWTSGPKFKLEREPGEGLEYNDRWNIPSHVKPGYIAFGDLVEKFDTDPEYIKHALERRGVEIKSPETPLSKEDVAYINHVFESRLKEKPVKGLKGYLLRLGLLRKKSEP
jgi:hypothetical protein